MRRRTVVGLAVGLAFAVVGALLLLVLTLNPDRFRPELAALLSSAAGRPVDLAGPVRIRWTPITRFEAEDVNLVAPDLHIDQVRVVVDRIALLRGRLRARRVELLGPRWRVSSSSDAPAEPLQLADPSSLPVARLEMSDGALEIDGEVVLSLSQVLITNLDTGEGARFELVGTARGVPIRGSGRWRGGGARVQLDKLRVSLPPGDLGGRVTLDLSGPVPRLEGRIDSDALIFTAGGASRTRAEHDALDPSALSGLDADLELTAGRITVGGLRIEAFKSPLKLVAGELAMRPLGRIANGDLNAALDVSGTTASWQLSLAVDGSDAGRMLSMLGLRHANPGGRLSLDLALSTSGRGRDALVAGLRGRLALDASGVSLEGRAAELAGADLVGALVRAMHRTSSRDLTLDCVAVRAAVADGTIATADGIALQSRAMNMRGGGSVSLTERGVDITLRPWARTGLGLSAGSVVGMVRVSGPLARPTVQLTEEALLRGGATVGAAVATGGLSLLAQGLLERARGDAPCAEVRRGVSQGGVGTRVQRGVGSAGEAIKQGLEEAGKALKGLFAQ